jgi:putative transposase
MRYRLIEAAKAEQAISRLCTVVGVTRPGFYAWRRRGPSLRQLGDDELARLIVTIYDGSLQTYGAPRVQLELADEHDVHVGRKRVARLMRKLELQGVSRRGKRPRTTVPDPKAPPAPDLVQRRFAADAPNRLWLADLTYVPTSEGWLFLGIVMDMFSRKIVGWAMRNNLEADLVVDALAMAVTRRRPPAGLVHHSDRGSQGGFNWSSQRLDEEGCDGSSAASCSGSCRAASDAVAGSAVGGAAGGAAAVLAGDRSRRLERGGGRRGRRVGGGWRPVVPRGWRDAVGQPAADVGSLLVVQRA